MIRKLAPLIVLMSLAARVYGGELSVVVDGLPRPATMTFPDSFSLAGSSAELDRRDRLLAFYLLNPAMKGSYDEVLLEDWSSPKRVPSIVVGSLGSLKAYQGRISQEDWDGIRQQFANASRKQISDVRRSYSPAVLAGSPVASDVTSELIWFEQQEDPNAVVLLAHLRGESVGEKSTEFSARKLIFHEGYVLFANVFVDASQPNALAIIKSFVEAISIKSI